jgi:hypothetical protein
MNKSYPIVKQHCVYAHILTDNDVYFGHTDNPQKRWFLSGYKDCTLFYNKAKECGWNNVKHIVIQDDLTRDQAIKIENFLIEQGWKDGFCINQFHSGHIKKDDENVYKRNMYKNNDEYREKQIKLNKDNYYKNREHIRKYQNNKRHTPEGKIYDRVHSFNQKHPDRKIETPKEAKQKYLETGYIPIYIKNDDLK